jgi:hypothetical protein
MIKGEFGLHWLFFGAAALLGLIYLWPVVITSIVIVFIIIFMIGVKIGKIDLKINIE